MGSAAPTDSGLPQLSGTPRSTHQSAADLTSCPPHLPHNWSQNSTGRPVQTMAACKPSSPSTSVSVEVHPLLPQIYPQTCPPPFKSYISTTSSTVPLTASRDQKPHLPKCVKPLRSRRAIVNILDKLMGKSAVFVFCSLTSLMLAIGCTLLTVGAMAVVDDKSLGSLIHMTCLSNVLPLNTVNLLKSVAVLLMVSGGVITTLGFLGCCGFLLRSRFMVGMFGCMMMLIVVGQLGTTTVALLNRDTIQARLRLNLLTALKKNYDGRLNSSNPISQAVDFVQLALGCCGVGSALDFDATPWFTSTSAMNATVPWTCCRVQKPAPWPTPLKADLVDENCPFKKPGHDNPYTGTPCFELGLEKIRQRSLDLVLFMITALEACAMGSAFIVANMLGKWTAKNKLKR